MNAGRVVLLAVAMSASLGSTRAQSFVDWDDPEARQTVPAQVFDAYARQMKIVGGTAAREGAWPFATALQHRGRFICGGTLIAPSWVLTAAHCVVEGETVWPAHEFSVAVGRIRIDDPAMERRRVTRVIAHPNYRSHQLPQNAFDIALLQLDRPITSITPVTALSVEDASTLLRPGVGSTAVGWGTTREGGVPVGRLLEVGLPLVSLQRCRQAYPMIGSHNRVICAGLEQGGKDSCQGDSGGPLLVQASGSGAARQIVQIGIVSWGHGCARPGFFGVYENVAAHIDFIRRHVPDVRLSEVAAAGGTPQATSPNARPQVSLALLPGTILVPNTPVQVRVTSSVTGYLVLAADNIDQRSGQRITFRAAPDEEIRLPVPRVIAGQPLALPPQGFTWGSPAQPGRYTLTAYLFATEEQAVDFARRLPPIPRHPNVRLAFGKVADVEERIFAASDLPPVVKLQVMAAPTPNVPPFVASAELTYEVR